MIFHIHYKNRAFPQYEISDDFSDECISLWLFSTLNLAKDFVQIEHGKGLSPVWLRKCFLSGPDSVKCFSHDLHGYGFSPGFSPVSLLGDF